MLRLLLSFLILVTVQAARAVDDTKPASSIDGTSKAEKKPLNWKIYAAFTTADATQIALTDPASERKLRLGFEPDSNGNRLISYSVTAETGELVAEVMIDGVRQKLAQKIKEMPRVPAGSGPGPSEEDRKKYESLSEKARAKFRDALREKFEDPAFRQAPEEERRNAIHSIFEKIEKEDKAGVNP